MSRRFRNTAEAPKKENNFESVKKILLKTLRKAGLENDIARYRFVLHWDEIVGEEIAKRARPDCIRNGALFIRVSDPAWAQELTFQKDIILSRLKKFLERDDIVKDVRFYVGG